MHCLIWTFVEFLAVQKWRFSRCVVDYFRLNISKIFVNFDDNNHTVRPEVDHKIQRGWFATINLAFLVLATVLVGSGVRWFGTVNMPRFPGVLPSGVKLKGGGGVWGVTHPSNSWFRGAQGKFARKIEKFEIRNTTIIAKVYLMKDCQCVRRWDH